MQFGSRVRLVKLNTFEINSRNMHVTCTMFAAPPGNSRDGESVRGTYEYVRIVFRRGSE